MFTNEINDLFLFADNIIRSCPPNKKSGQREDNYKI